MPPIADLLKTERIDLNCRISSKKRLMEHIAGLLATGTGVDQQQVFRVLIDRERLGSTGVGHGVALPHGRMAEVGDAVLALATLSEPLDYQAPDRQHVDIVVGLLVPEKATDTHLQILARLAGLLSQPALRAQLLAAGGAEEAAAALSGTG